MHVYFLSRDYKVVLENKKDASAEYALPIGQAEMTRLIQQIVFELLGRLEIDNWKRLLKTLTLKTDNQTDP